MKTKAAPKPITRTFQATSSSILAYRAGMQSLGITDPRVISNSYLRFLRYRAWVARRQGEVRWSSAPTTVHVETQRGTGGWTMVHFSETP